MYQHELDVRRSNIAQMAQEIERLKREVSRLKGMWPSAKVVA